MNSFYPKNITELPEADIPFDGVKGWLSQAEDHQIVFFEIDPVGLIEEHKHGDQWGTVFQGEMKLTIDGETKSYRGGDSYYIPAGIPHSAFFKEKTWLMDFFADKSRYKPKKKK